ncbi:YlbG family protein [Alkalibacillus salilacus]|uniref:UPF0298 protein J2S77_001170 n=1 Tax=Alkalibacillus salilacus TaxID=284582 RepID=A0ABT9VE04_9BACI|nr:YlbG family protein [Alkalibacillus salilacus]MDQ0159206.1 uncharacterized protein YlbG (UPF0298 family) [Alkalibacillus salilacus]
MFTKRQGLIIWFKHIKQAKKLRRYGHLIYTSKRMKYAVLYVNQEDLEDIEEELNELSFVKYVDRSHKPDIDTAYQGMLNKTHDLEAEMESYYKSG